MLRTVRMVFLGIPKERLKYTQLLVKSSAEDWPEEDQAMLQKAIKFNIGMKAVGGSGAGYAAWVTAPGLSWAAVPALIPKALAFVILFRCMSVPAALHFEKVAQVLAIKHNLIPPP